MHFSTSKIILELAFQRLKQKALLYEGENYYSELVKNTLKNFLKNDWKWDKKQAVNSIKEWRKKSLLKLNSSECLVFMFTEVPKNKNYYITKIESCSKEK